MIVRRIEESSDTFEVSRIVRSGFWFKRVWAQFRWNGQTDYLAQAYWYPEGTAAPRNVVRKIVSLVKEENRLHHLRRMRFEREEERRKALDDAKRWKSRPALPPAIAEYRE